MGDARRYRGRFRRFGHEVRDPPGCEPRARRQDGGRVGVVRVDADHSCRVARADLRREAGGPGRRGELHQGHPRFVRE